MPEILALFGGIVVGSIAAYGVKNIIRNWQLILRVSLFVLTVFLVSITVAIAVEVVPENHGEFGDWLGYWGNIIGSIIGAIFAAVLSVYISLNVQTKIQRSQMKYDYQMKTYFDNIDTLLNHVKKIQSVCCNLQVSINSLRNAARDFNDKQDHENLCNYLNVIDGLVTSSPEPDQSSFLDSVSCQKSLIEKLKESDHFLLYVAIIGPNFLENIEKLAYYGTLLDDFSSSVKSFNINMGKLDNRYSKKMEQDSKHVAMTINESFDTPEYFQDMVKLVTASECFKDIKNLPDDLQSISGDIRNEVIQTQF